MVGSAQMALMQVGAKEGDLQMGLKLVEVMLEGLVGVVRVPQELVVGKGVEREGEMGVGWVVVMVGVVKVAVKQEVVRGVLVGVMQGVVMGA